MNIENKAVSEKTYSLRLPPLPAGEKPLEIDFYEIKSTMPKSTLAEIGIYLENPTYQIIYDYENDKDIEIELKPGESPFIQIDEERAISYMGIGIYLLSYKNPAERKRDKQSFFRLFSEKKAATKERQVPEIAATFDYHQQYYLVLRIKVIANGKTNDDLYKGIIVRPQKYAFEMVNDE